MDITQHIPKQTQKEKIIRINWNIFDLFYIKGQEMSHVVFLGTNVNAGHCNARARVAALQ